MIKKIKWGILGCASITERALIPAITKSKNGILYGIASRNQKKAQEWTDKFEFHKSYADYHLLLDDPEIEAVYIPLPNHLHGKWSILTAKAGKSVLCEKPFSLTAVEARKMIQASEKNNILIMEAFMYRFHPQMDKVLQLLESGEIGEIKTFHSSFTFPFEINSNYRWTMKMGGGSLYDVGCYTLSSARLVMGDEPLSVFATAHIHPRLKVDLSCHMIMEFPGKRFALLDSSFETQFQSYLSIIGTHGKITLNRAFSAKLLDVQIQIQKGDSIKTIGIPSTDQYQKMVEHFGDCMQKKMTPRYPVDDAYYNMRVMDAIFKSIRTGKTVSLIP